MRCPRSQQVVSLDKFAQDRESILGLRAMNKVSLKIEQFHRHGLLVCAVIVCLLATPAEARRFDMKSERFATYFGASGGATLMSDYAYGQAAGTGVTTDQVVPYNLSGEFGVVFSGEAAALRLAAEYVIGKTMTGVKGLNSAGVQYFEVDSKIGAFIPTVGLEAPLLKWTDTRIVLGAGIGIAAVSLDQEYRMTAAGTAALGVGNYTEKASGSATVWRAYVGGETHLVDTTTMLCELGYRSLQVGSLQSTKDTTAITGAQTQGTTLLNSDGSARAFDLGGGYVSVLFRFYL